MLMGLIFFCKRISLDGPPLHMFNCKSTQLLIFVEISLFRQNDQVDHVELGHFSWTWKNDISLLFCVRLRFLFFFSNFLFALLDQLKGLMFYFPCSLLSIFHANLVIRLELLPYIPDGSWYLSLWYSCEASYIPVYLFVCLFFSFSFSWKHETSDCWGFNCKESDDFFWG